MKNTKLALSLLSLVVSNLLITNNVASSETLEEAKTKHPNASFKVNTQDGSFTYSYNQNNLSEPPQNFNTHSNHDVPQNRYFPENDALKATESQSENMMRNQPSSPSIPVNTPMQNDLSTEQVPKPHSQVTENAYGKDENGFINSINIDLLYDELALSEFNEHAKTIDGKPLAMDNGKIISNPNFTNKNNLYTPGQCTFYVFDKRAADGKTISTFWGDAKNWASQAQADGFEVNHQPKKGAIFQTPIGVWGHVAYVERVNMDGSVFISEMNYIAPYIVSTRTISASEARSYNYIH